MQRACRGQLYCAIDASGFHMDLLVIWTYLGALPDSLLTFFVMHQEGGVRILLIEQPAVIVQGASIKHRVVTDAAAPSL